MGPSYLKPGLVPSIMKNKVLAIKGSDLRPGFIMHREQLESYHTASSQIAASNRSLHMEQSQSTQPALSQVGWEPFHLHLTIIERAGRCSKHN